MSEPERDFIHRIADFFAAKNSLDARLVRVEGFVIIVATILLLMYVLHFYGLRSRSSALNLVLVILDAVSASIVTYTIGLAENASSDEDGKLLQWEEELLQVQVVLLTILKRSISDVSDYSTDQKQNRRTQVSGVMESVWVVYLNVTRGSKFTAPLWILWALNFSKILQRIIYHESAHKSYGAGRNSILVDTYMKSEPELCHPNKVDQALQSSYKYLVLGEDKQQVKLQPPDYMLKLRLTREDKFITLDKIWQCEGRLLSATGLDVNGTELKDLCLSFSMYKLLRLRFDNIHQSPESDPTKHPNLFWKGLISDGFERPFRVIEAELALLGDLFYTMYPVIFSKGFPIFNIAVALMMDGTCCYAAVLLFTNKYRPITCKVVTLVLLIAVTLKESWDIIGYISSDWAKVVLLCKYVEKRSWQESKCVEKVLGCLCRLRIRKRWHGQISQYSLLRSFNYRPWNLGSKLTWGLINVTAQGSRECNPIRVPDAVKEAVRNSLILSNGQLTNGKTSLLERNKVEISWIPEQKTRTHSILIWHIATSLCEIELLLKCKANDRNLTGLKKYLKKPISWAACIKNRWKPLPFYVNLENLEVNGSLRHHYEIAASMSRYCAYLVAFRPGLVYDDSPLLVERMFKEVITQAQEYFKGLSSIEDLYKKMMKTAKPSDTMIAEGAELGKQLIQTIESDEIRWKVLAEFWSEWILYMAPSDNTSAHASALARGGEFITHLWALLFHANFPEQSEAPGSTV